MFQQMVLSTGAHVSVRTATSRPEPGPGEVKKVQIACAAKHQTVSSGKSSAPSERTPCRSKPSHGFRVGAEFFILQRFPRKQREKSSKTVMPHGIRRTSDPKARAGIRPAGLPNAPTAAENGGLRPREPAESSVSGSTTDVLTKKKRSGISAGSLFRSLRTKAGGWNHHPSFRKMLAIRRPEP